MESLNTQLLPFFEWLLRTTVQASLLICVILLLQRILRNRLCIRWHYGLWLLLLVRMSLPWAPQSRASLFNLIPRSAHQQRAEYEQQGNGRQSVGSDVAGSEPVESVPASPATTTQESPEAVTATPSINRDVQNQIKPDFTRIVKILPLLWLIGALVLAVYVGAGNFNLWRIVKRRRPLIDQKILELLEDCKVQMGIQTILGIVPTDKVESPALFGFVRPRLLLPHGMIETLSQQELRYVLLHELAHLKRHDIYIGWLMSLLQVLHWFNPLVWLAFYRMRSDRELACDALVLARTQNEEPKSYGRIIVNLVERFSRPQRLPGMAGILETKAQLKRRVTMIANFKKNSYQWSPLSVILIVILAGVSLPEAIRTEASRIASKEPVRNITLRRVWSYSYPVTDGETSPDGRYLSYTDWQTGDLAIYDIAAGTKRRLTNKGTWDESDESAYSSRWSPDGEQIVYGWEMGPGSVELRIIGTDGSGHRVLYRTDEQHRWAEPCDWFPDGKGILASLTARDGTDKIVRISTADGSLHVLKTVGKDCLHHATLSPDGQYIAYDFKPEDDDSSSNLDISVMSTDATREVSLVKHSSGDLVLGWAPDGKSILFASDRTGAWGMWLIAVADGKPQGTPELVKQIVGRFEPMGFTGEGSYYYSTSRGSDDIYIATIDPETNRAMAPPKKAIERYEGSNIAAAYSPDGNCIAYIHRLGFVPPNRSRGNVLCIRSLKTGKERECSLNLSNIIRYSSLRWSPDGRSILVNGYNDKDSFGVYRIDVETWEAKYLVQSNTCEWSGDGKAIIYRGGDPGFKVSQIVMRNLEDGNEEVLHRSPSDEFIFNIALSPDGQFLALRCIRPTSLKIMPLTGGQVRELPEFEKVASAHKPIAWTADGKHILFSGNEAGGGKHPLYRISVDSGQVEKVGLEKNRYFTLSAHPDGQHILVAGTESAPESEVWVMENFLPDTPVAKPEPTIQRVWSGPGVDLEGAPSPDGRYLSYVDWDTGDLAVYEIASGTKRRLTNKGSWDESDEFAQFSHFSPDGRQIVYDWYNKDDFIELRIVGLDGSEPQILYRNEEVTWAQIYDWSPDGKQILACFDNKEGSEQIVLVSVADGSVSVLKTLNKYPQKMSFSPDGRYIVYDFPEKEDSPERDIFLLLTDGSREIPLIEHPADDRVLDWTPDGRHVLFTSDRSGSPCVWLIAIADGMAVGIPKLVKPDIGQKFIPMGFAKDDSFYYGCGGGRVSDVYTARLDPQTGKVLIPPKKEIQRFEGHNLTPDYSPDGKYLAYVSNRGRRFFLCIRSLETGMERELPSKLRQILHPRWSPDGSSILIAGMDYNSNRFGHYQVDPQTGAFTLVLPTSEDFRFNTHEWFHDGESYFLGRSSRKDKVSQIMLREIKSGTEKEIYRMTGLGRFRLACSPDGKWLAFINYAKEGALRIIPAAGGEPRELYMCEQNNEQLITLRWSADGKYIFFVIREIEQKKLGLWRIPIEGGEPLEIELETNLIGLSVHPDGQHIAFGAGERQPAEVWVMENFLPATVTAVRK